MSIGFRYFAQYGGNEFPFPPKQGRRLPLYNTQNLPKILMNLNTQNFFSFELRPSVRPRGWGPSVRRGEVRLSGGGVR